MKKPVRLNYQGRVILQAQNRVIHHELGWLREDNKPSWAGWFYEGVMRRRSFGKRRYWELQHMKTRRKVWPEEVERTERAAYWRSEDGTYFATSLSVILPPPVRSGGYHSLEALKKLKGEA